MARSGGAFPGKRGDASRSQRPRRAAGGRFSEKERERPTAFAYRAARVTNGETVRDPSCNVVAWSGIGIPSTRAINLK